MKTYDLTQGENKASAAFWHCKGVSVPYSEVGAPRTLAVLPDVVRLDVDSRSKDSSQKLSIRVVNLAEERKVGDKKVVGVREEGEVEFSDGDAKGKGKVTVFLSNEVPGRVVEVITDFEVGGVKFQTLNRVQAFKVVDEK